MSNQPRWAWWVVGIVIPVTGILVSIQLADSGSDTSDKDTAGQSANTSTAAPPAATGGNAAPASMPAANQPAKVLAGPVRITLTENASYVDLDSASPVAQPSSRKGSDAAIGFMLPDLSLYPPSSGNVEAIMSPDGPEPTRDQCAEAIAKRGTYTSGELSQGMRLCLQTDEGRTAYLRITAVPTQKAVTLEATVWE